MFRPTFGSFVLMLGNLELHHIFFAS